MAAYWAMTTRRFVAAATVACGEVTGHVTAAATFVHVYHDPVGASWVLIVEPAGGVESNEYVTESMLLGFVALRLYFTELTTKPLIAPEPSPALVAATLFDAV
jgi:hypothetical protein